MAKAKAFTLAETLITIGLIGVVAAMTLPTVISTFQDKIAVARLKKAYSVLENNYQNYITLERRSYIMVFGRCFELWDIRRL